MQNFVVNWTPCCVLNLKLKNHNLFFKQCLERVIKSNFHLNVIFKNEGMFYLACNDKKTVFFTSTDHRGYKLLSNQNVCDALSYLLNNIYIIFGNKLYRQIVGIPMGTNCDPLVTDLFLFCYERDFMT